MAEKSCKHCAMKIPAAAKVCPHCRRKQGISFGKGCLIAIAVIFGFIVFLAVLGIIISTCEKTKHPTAGPESAITPPAPAPIVNVILPNADERRKILSVLKAEKDEFKKATFYNHRGTPTGGNQIHLYIAESDDGYTLRLFVMYESDDWIIWKKMILKVGEEVATFEPSLLAVKRDNAYGKVWEVLDVAVASGISGNSNLSIKEDIALIYAMLLKADSADIRLEGKRMFDRKISKEEIKRIHEVSKVFHALFEEKK